MSRSRHHCCALFAVAITTLFVAACSWGASADKPAAPAHTPIPAGLRLAAVFGDNMVLQRDTDVPVWGWAKPDAAVRVEVAGRTAATTATRDGKWKAVLNPMPAGGPHTMVVASEGGERILHNVMLGEVWVASGQSNMDMRVSYVRDSAKEIAGAKRPDIRLFQVGRGSADTLQEDVVTKGWRECSPQTVADFSAAGYFFARDIADKLRVPVGVIQTTYGGTPAESWTSEEALGKLPDFRDSVKKLEHNGESTETAQSRFIKAKAAWDKLSVELDAGYKAKPQWSSPDSSRRGWRSMMLPQAWEDAGLDGYDGVVWFSRDFDLPAAMAGKDAVLRLGAVDDRDVTFVNGREVGRMSFYSLPRRYPVPASLLKAGRNNVTVRVLYTGGAGGVLGKPGDLFIQTTGTAEITSVSLAGKWQYRPALDLKRLPPVPVPPENPYRLAGLYNGMVAPLVPLAIRGVIWYQGEANAPKAFQYRTLFPAMVSDWRAHWGRGYFPFLFVELAAYMERLPQPHDSAWAELREAQQMALELPATAMASAIDIGEAGDIHPSNKQDVGRRLALGARAIAYGEKIVYSGPVYTAAIRCAWLEPA